MSPFQGTVQNSLYGGKLFNLLVDTKEEHAMLPLKQPQSPALRREQAPRDVQGLSPAGADAVAPVLGDLR